MKTVKFGLRVKGTDVILKYSQVKIAGKTGDIEVYEVSEMGNSEWLVDDLETIKAALKKETSWYNTTKETPIIVNAVDNLEIVQITNITRIEVCNEKMSYQNDDNYHRQKVEEALRMLASVSKDEELVSGVQPNNEDNKKEPLVANTESAEYKENKVKKETVRVVALAEKLHVGKAKVKCVKDIPKELGSVRLKIDPVSYCFKEGKFYLAYTKNQKLFIMNDDKIPEFICNATSEKHWEDNHFFNTHFIVEEYLD